MSDEEQDQSFLGASSGADDSEMEWEEVDIAAAAAPVVDLAPVISNKVIEITLPTAKGKEKAAPK